MNGKGDRDRTTDRDAYDRGWERIFGGNIDSTEEAVSFPDVGATPTSSTIENTDWIKVCFAVPLLWQCTSRVHKRWLGIRRTSDWNVGKENP